MASKRRAAFLILALSGLTVGLFLPTYHLRRKVTVAQALWNRNDCYILLGYRLNGWRATPAREVWEVAKTSLSPFAVTRPDISRVRATLVHSGSAGARRWDAKF